MNKFKNFCRRNKGVLLFCSGVIVSASVGIFLMKINKSKPNPIKVTNPKYFKTIEEAINEFKNLEKITDHPALFGWGKEAYGVYDEGPFVSFSKES